MDDLLRTFTRFMEAWPLLEPALTALPMETHRKEHVWAAIEAGDAQLWTNDTAAAVSEIAVYPTGLRALNVWLAGGDLSGVKALDAEIDAYAKLKNCGARTIMGRRGWVKALDGYRDGGCMMMKDLG